VDGLQPKVSFSFEGLEQATPPLPVVESSLIIIFGQHSVSQGSPSAENAELPQLLFFLPETVDNVSCVDLRQGEFPDFHCSEDQPLPVLDRRELVLRLHLQGYSCPLASFFLVELNQNSLGHVTPLVLDALAPGLTWFLLVDRILIDVAAAYLPYMREVLASDAGPRGNPV